MKHTQPLGRFLLPSESRMEVNNNILYDRHVSLLIDFNQTH
jgi:hypothetical protein